MRNVIQLNRLGRLDGQGDAENGLGVGVPDPTAPLDTMVTDGNVVRFSGARGISVVNAATGTFTHHVVTDNQEAGAVVETAQPIPPVSANLATGGVIVARGNQWEHCGTGSVCNVLAVLRNDVRPHDVGTDIGTPTGPGSGPVPMIARVVPSRPRAGDFVRVYNAALDNRGGTFNTIDGAACTDAGIRGGQPVGLPADHCSPENPNVVTQNRLVGWANRVTITMGGQQIDADVHAVTPTC